MKIFISWSGARSKALAIALRDWIPLVLQYAKPWVSDKDIGAGDRWAQSIAGELESANFGIICITPENLQSEWVLFEAGALSKSMLDAKVIPLLYGLELSDLSGPLSQFQAQKVEETGIADVIRAINSVSEAPTSDAIVNRLVPQLWPSLESDLGKIPDTQPSEKHMRPQHEILEELVTSVRSINGRMSEFDFDRFDRDRSYRRRPVRFHPRMIDEFAMMSERDGDGPVALLIIAGLVREDLPWLAELLVESYREIRDGSAKDLDRVTQRLHRTTRDLMHGPLREFMVGSKEAMMILEELPLILDLALHDLPRRPNKSTPKTQEE